VRAILTDLAIGDGGGVGLFVREDLGPGGRLDWGGSTLCRGENAGEDFDPRLVASGIDTKGTGLLKSWIKKGNTGKQCSTGLGYIIISSLLVGRR